MFLVHYPATNDYGYWKFSKYIKTAPKAIAKFFALYESRPVEEDVLDVTLTFIERGMSS